MNNFDLGRMMAKFANANLFANRAMHHVNNQAQNFALNS